MGKTDISVIGQKVGNLTYVGEDVPKGKSRFIFAKCSCGNIFSVSYSKAKTFYTKSCGCYRSLANKARATHGGCGSRTYVIYNTMKTRCLNEKSSNFKVYGGRGIKICDRWVNSYENFRNDMGECPQGKSLDRIDTDGNYDPSNCRWVSQKEQCNNKRTNIKLEYLGQIKTVAEWAESLGISRYTLYSRVKRKLNIDMVMSTSNTSQNDGKRR